MSELAEALRAIAQNDYMIDMHYLPEGDTLVGAAGRIEALEANAGAWEGEVMRYEDHLKEVERLRDLLDRQAEQARQWKTAYLACSGRGYDDA